MEELNPYFGILVLGFFSLGFLVTMLLLSVWLGPKNPTKTKQIPFECGAEPVGNVREQRFSVRFYLVAMLFILFDIEVIFMYPWAVVLENPLLAKQAYWLMFSFMLVFLVGLVYVWKKGVLDWND